MSHQVNGSQRRRGGHVWPCPLDSPHSKLRLAQVIPASGLSIPKSLPDDVLQVGVHAAMRASPAGASLAARQDGWPAAIASGTSINQPVFTS